MLKTDSIFPRCPVFLARRHLDGGIVRVGAALILIWMASANAKAQTITTLTMFNGGNGSNPRGSLTLAGNVLYGAAAGGGAHSQGTVYSLPVKGGAPTVLTSFSFGGMFGSVPNGGLLLINNELYGTTQYGGNLTVADSGGAGTVYSLGVSGGSPTVLAAFNVTDGEMPMAGLTLVGNSLYGTTEYGGSGSDPTYLSSGVGTVFRVPLSGGTPTDVAHLTENGTNPVSNLELSEGMLYGLDGGNSTNPEGTAVFSLSVSGGTPTALWQFSGVTGPILPAGHLILNGNTLYGVGNEFFAVPVSGGALTLMSSYSSSSEYGLRGLAAGDNTLYAADELGGAYGLGAIVSVPMNGGNPTVLASFNGTNGARPDGLIVSGNTLYGVCQYGGSGFTSGTTNTGDGTVFALVLGPPTDVWHNARGGSWNTASNWASGLVPNGTGSQAVLGSSATAACAITLDGDQTVSSLTFSNSAAGCTLTTGSGGTLTLNNSSGTGGSQLLVIAGSHSITAPVIVAGGGLTVSGSSRGRLLISGDITDDSGAESLTLNGDGTGVLVLSGTNTYGGGTIVEAGTLIATNGEALPDGSSLIVGSNIALFPSYAPITPATVAAPVPEPGTLPLLTAALAAAQVYRRARRS